MPEWVVEIAKISTNLAIVIVFVLYLNKQSKVMESVSERCHTTSENGHKAIAAIAAAVLELKAEIMRK